MMDHPFSPTRPIEESDFVAAQTPINLLMRVAVSVLTPNLKMMDKEMHDGLRKRGFMIGWGEKHGRGEIGPFGLIYFTGGGISEFAGLETVVLMEY